MPEEEATFDHIWFVSTPCVCCGADGLMLLAMRGSKLHTSSRICWLYIMLAQKWTRTSLCHEQITKIADRTKHSVNSGPPLSNQMFLYCLNSTTSRSPLSPFLSHLIIVQHHLLCKATRSVRPLRPVPSTPATSQRAIFTSRPSVSQLNSLHTFTDEDEMLREAGMLFLALSGPVCDTQSNPVARIRLTKRFATDIVGPKVREMDENEMMDPSIINGLFEQGSIPLAPFLCQGLSD